MGGVIGTVVSLAINRFLPLSEYSLICGYATFNLSTILILFSGVFITALCVDWSGETVTFCNVNYDW